MKERIEESTNGSHILVVDDDEAVGRLIQRWCQNCGYSCSFASNGEEAIAHLEKAPVDVVIADIIMPAIDGIKLTRIIRERYDSDVILMTGFADLYSYGEIIERGGSDFLSKPVNPKELIIRLGRVLRDRAVRSALQRSVTQLRELLDETTHTLGMAVESRDPSTYAHQTPAPESGRFHPGRISP